VYLPTRGIDIIHASTSEAYEFINVNFGPGPVIFLVHQGLPNAYCMRPELYQCIQEKRMVQQTEALVGGWSLGKDTSSLLDTGKP
jgi:hypothetical protein